MSVYVVDIIGGGVYDDLWHALLEKIYTLTHIYLYRCVCVFVYNNSDWRKKEIERKLWFVKGSFISLWIWTEDNTRGWP